MAIKCRPGAATRVQLVLPHMIGSTSQLGPIVCILKQPAAVHRADFFSSQPTEVVASQLPTTAVSPSARRLALWIPTVSSATSRMQFLISSRNAANMAVTFTGNLICQSFSAETFPSSPTLYLYGMENHLCCAVDKRLVLSQRSVMHAFAYTLLHRLSKSFILRITSQHRIQSKPSSLTGLFPGWSQRCISRDKTSRWRTCGKETVLTARSMMISRAILKM